MNVLLKFPLSYEDRMYRENIYGMFSMFYHYASTMGTLYFYFLWTINVTSSQNYLKNEVG